ncbi:MAG: mannonate dehydratase [Pseudomonadota bacterium]
MRETWRWFGPDDTTTLAMVRQAGAAGIVTALHDLPPGAPWPAEAIAARQEILAEAGFAWEVVESLPVSDAIKARRGPWQAHIAAWIESLEALAAAGIQVVCYNFMPVLDWTRTALAHPLPSGGTALAFDLIDFAAFDIHDLARPGATTDYPEDVAAEAATRWQAMDTPSRARLAHAIGAGLPGEGARDKARLRGGLAAFEGVGADDLRANLAAFLQAVVPEAECLGLRLCCHPDDPPFPILGLPRVVSTEADYAALVAAAPSPANGITFCTGSLGARGDADLPGFVARLGPHIHFAHLRNTRRTAIWGPRASFFEDGHLAGETDMRAVVAALLAEEARRRAESRTDAEIPMRPDHGHDILDDLGRGGVPGYPAIGRLKGLAELRGLMHALAP